MIITSRARAFGALLLLAGLADLSPVGAQEPTRAPASDTRRPAATPAPPAAEPPRPAWLKPFRDLLGDIASLPHKDNTTWLTLGLASAAAAHRLDDQLSEHLSRVKRQPFEPGAVVGGTPLELSASFAAYLIGRAAGRPRAMNAGADLIRAQLLAEILTTGVKQTARRSRPEGSGFSFPSGHTGVSFASATVLQRHFGWKVGAPAYAVASYVAASRIQMRRHYLSDVVFGAAVGIVAGRTVTAGRSKLVLAPIAALDGRGAGLALAWTGRP
ncbi:MAG: phosphatase PAP2 family protein [Acidobacteria bacterium]|nr:phosphatase PAP2 family protein [Acidobacteriota bacterium]